LYGFRDDAGCTDGRYLSGGLADAEGAD